MINEVLFYLKQDKLSFEYIKYNSYWFEVLRKDKTLINKFIEEVKSKYKLTTLDRINIISERINMISNLMSIIS